MDSTLATEQTFFSDRDAVLAEIASICAPSSTPQPGDTAWELAFDALEKMLVKYQEQPLILAPHMEEMVGPLMGQLLEAIGANEGKQSGVSAEHLHRVCKVLQLICRVRGHKHVSKFFPHEVDQLEGCLSLLRSQDKAEHGKWETRYVLMLWLTVLCLIPFDICSLDSTMHISTTTEESPGAQGHENTSSLVSLVRNICQEYLEDPGPTREAAASCLAALLTRPDMESGVLSGFVMWSLGVMDSWISKGMAALNELTAESFRLLGMLSCLAKVFKTGHRSKILPHATSILGPCLVLFAQPNQMHTRKLLTKLCQRLGTTFLPPRVAKWRYQRGNRSLANNLKMGKTDIMMPTELGKGAAGGQGQAAAGNGEGGSMKSTESTGKNEEEEEEEDSEDVPLELDDIMEVLLTSLRDKDTVVRWSAAKGIGRITMRLPEAFGDDTVEAVLELFQDADDDSSWHGGCLCLAELSRRGLLLPSRLAQTVPLICKAIHFDILRGQHSVGSHVRDASCYVCWAFARAYSSEVMRPFVSSLAEAMLLTAVYDREINCRRAASAAFQENVGRQGNQNFPNGIEIITIADYFSLGNRTAAYTSIAPSIVEMANWYVEPFVDYLIGSKVGHWDKEVRILAGKGLSEIVPLSPALVISRMDVLLTKCVSVKLPNRHGATLAVAEIVLALSTIDVPLPSELADRIVGLINDFATKRLYRGRGGELLRQAAALLIENIARASLEIPIKLQVQLVEVLNENLRQPHEYIQVSSADALRHFLFTYFPVALEKGPSSRLEDLTTQRYLNGLAAPENAAVARGCALAIGVLPAKFILAKEGRVEAVLEALGGAISPQHTVQGEADAETRRNASHALVEVSERLIAYAIGDALCRTVVETTLRHLLVAAEDYSIDKRGDIGSWCRIAALKGVERIVIACKRRSEHENGSSLNLGADISSTSEVQEGDHVFTCFGEGVVRTVDVKSSCFVDFPVPSTGSGLMPSGGIFRLANIKMMSGKGRGVTQAMGATILAKEDTLVIFTTIMKQLAEKLDIVRDVAGSVLRNLVAATDEASTPIPNRAEIVACNSPVLLQKHGKDTLSALNINWGQPGDVFPYLMYLMETGSVYFDAIVSGTIISVGGMTETVVKESSKALLHWCADMLKQGTPDMVVRFARSLEALFEEKVGDDRVIVPLLKSLQLLFSEGAFGDSLDGTDVAMNFLNLIKNEMSGCGDVNKLMACINVVVLLLDVSGPARFGAMKSLLFLLGHKYPRIRKCTAEHLYLHMIADPCMCGVERATEESTGRGAFVANDEELTSVNDMLATTVWDQSIQLARSKRTQIYELMGIELKIKKKEGANGRGEAKTDELDSYAALVNEVGY